MPEHKVQCVKLHKELPGLDEPPFDTELGRKIYDNVSAEAWKAGRSSARCCSTSTVSTPRGVRIRK